MKIMDNEESETTKFIDMLLVVMSIIFASSTQLIDKFVYYNIFALLVFAFLSFAILARVFYNLKRVTPDDIFVPNIFYSIASLVMSLSFSLVFVSFFKVIVLPEQKYTPIFAVIAAAVSLFIFIYLIREYFSYEFIVKYQVYILVIFGIVAILKGAILFVFTIVAMSLISYILVVFVYCKLKGIENALNLLQSIATNICLILMICLVSGLIWYADNWILTIIFNNTTQYSDYLIQNASVIIDNTTVTIVNATI